MAKGKKRRGNRQSQSVQSSHANQPEPWRQTATNSPASAAPTSRLQTIEQERAKHALHAVNTWLVQGKEDQKELKSYVVGMPAMILMSGFGQTCAFYKSKGGNHEQILDVLTGWLKKDDLMKFITHSSAQEYQLAQAESLAWLNWLKNFARAYLKGDDDEPAAS